MEPGNNGDSILAKTEISISMHENMVPEQDAMRLGYLQGPCYDQLHCLLEVPI